jgi:predicted outer membrane repeat protein
MSRRSVVLGSLVAVVAVAAVFVPVGSADHPPCLVSNERTGVGHRTAQDAIAASASGDTLIVKGTCPGTAIIPSFRTLTLKGVSNPSFGIATLDGGGAPIVAVLANATATLSNLVITNGAGFLGGGVYNGGILTLTGSSVTNNTASLVGGGIYNTGGGNGANGMLTVIDSTISRNTAPNGGGIFGDHGTVTLINTTVSDNTATINGGGIINFDTMSLTGSTVTGNTAEVDGGGIYSGGILTLTDSTVTNNTATTGAGGGIYQLYGNLSFTNTTVANNNPDNCANVICP